MKRSQRFLGLLSVGSLYLDNAGHRMDSSLAHDTGQVQARIRAAKQAAHTDTSEPSDGLFGGPLERQAPSCNTGLESAPSCSPRPDGRCAPSLTAEGEETPTAGLSATVDYLRVTFKTLSLEETLSIWERDGLDWKHEARGRNFYQKRCHRGAITCLYEGAQPGMGCHVELTGEGCRQAEAEGLIPNSDWGGFLGYLIACGGKLTRLDLALDDQSGGLDRNTLSEAYEAGQFACRAHGKNVRRIEDKAGGFTLYFGARTGGKLVRIYDKAAQLEQDGHWIRVELELHDEVAQKMAQRLAATPDSAGELTAGAVRDFVRFTTGGQVQACRRPEAAWWVSFLGGVSRLKLTLEPVIRSVEKAYEWLKKQAAPSLAVIWLEAQQYGPEALLGLVEDGKRRMRSMHWAMLGFTGHSTREGWTPAVNPEVERVQGDFLPATP